MLWQVHMLVQNWPKIVDDTVAAKTKPAYIQKNILWVYVCNSMWMQHMQAMKLQILKKVRMFLPDADISDIRWLMQPHDTDTDVPDKTHREIKPPDPERKKAFTEMATIVKNKACRKALCRLWEVFHEK